MPEERRVNLHSRQLQPSDSPLSYIGCVTAPQRLLVENTSTTAIHKRTKYFATRCTFRDAIPQTLAVNSAYLTESSHRGAQYSCVASRKRKMSLKCSSLRHQTKVNLLQNFHDQTPFVYWSQNIPELEKLLRCSHSNALIASSWVAC